MCILTEFIRCPYADCAYRSKQCNCLAAHIFDIHCQWPIQCESRKPSDPRYRRVKRRFTIIEDKFRNRLLNTASRAKVKPVPEENHREEVAEGASLEGGCYDEILAVLEKRALPESLLFAPRPEASPEQH